MDLRKNFLFCCFYSDKTSRVLQFRRLMLCSVVEEMSFNDISILSSDGHFVQLS